MSTARFVTATIASAAIAWIGLIHLIATVGSPTPTTPPQAPPLSTGSFVAEPPATLPTLVAHQAPGPSSLTADERTLVDWAVDRFALVGLDVPEVDIAFHEHTRPCDGNHGMYRGGGDREPSVTVCIPDHGTVASDLERQRTLVHELAHAWEQANLADRDRLALLDRLGADDWYAPDAPWAERGAERFAETIVWGLYDQLRRPTLIDLPCRELHAAFHQITGHTAPGPLEAACTFETKENNR